MTVEAMDRHSLVENTFGMGIFNKKSANSASVSVVTYGSEFIRELEEAVTRGSSGIQMVFPNALMEEVDHSIKSHSGSVNVLCDDEMQFLDVVGESFHQDAIGEVHRRLEQEKDSRSDWFAGILLPEPHNPHDSNAVMVLLVTDAEDGDGYEVITVGHLAREQAKKVQKKLIKFLNGGAIIPVLLRISGGTEDKPTFGVIARAKTKALHF